MPRPAIDDVLWADMTPAQRSEAVRSGRATLRQMVEGLLDGSDELRRVCREFLAHTDASFKELPHEEAPPNYQSKEEAQMVTPGLAKELPDSTAEMPAARHKRRRLGLPRGYSPRLYRRKPKL